MLISKSLINFIESMFTLLFKKNISKYENNKKNQNKKYLEIGTRSIKKENKGPKFFSCLGSSN
jgi:hypothetical protein